MFQLTVYSPYEVKPYHLPPHSYLNNCLRTTKFDAAGMSCSAFDNN